MTPFLSKRILLVDDSRDTLAALESLLRRRGFNVVSVTSPEEGLRLAENQPFDVVVTDFKMPGMNGLDFVHRLHRIAPRTHVVLITGYPSEYEERRPSALGVDAYFIKPFDPAVFLKAVSELAA
jgi:CheY-like chemotaxis protein